MSVCRGRSAAGAVLFGTVGHVQVVVDVCSAERHLVVVTQRIACIHRDRIDKYLDTLLADQTARKALPPTTAKSRNRKMADCPSYY